MTEHLIRVDAPKMRGRPCFGLIQRDGLIIEGAPYGMACLKRARITAAREAVLWFRSRGAQVQWWEVNNG